MSIINNFMLAGDEGYNIQRSLRFRSSASSYLNRTPASAGNRRTWTYSAWVKRGSLSSYQRLMTATIGSDEHILLRDTNAFHYYSGNAGINLFTNQVLRDTSAWYHLIIAIDTTQATSSNRAKMYINGAQVTSFNTETYPTQNADTGINSTIAHGIGGADYSQYFDGYLAEMNFIDGQALTPSSFGETDVLTGVWKPKKYAGTYGTNGFYLPFTDVATTSGSNAGLGKDFSGNGNYWNTNNISVTTGTTYDSMTDVPTLTSATTANYCVWNPVNVSGGGSTITDGNLACNAGSVSTYGKILGSIGMTTGKWYCEITVTAIGSLGAIGLGDGTPPSGSTGLGGVAGELAYQSNGNKYTNATATAYGATYTTNDVIGIAYDADAGSVTFYKNNTSQGAITGLSGTKYFAVGSSGGTNPQYVSNFGQRPFTYTPPTGFVALNTFNLPEPSIKQGNKHFDNLLYTANVSGGKTMSGLQFQPDFIWIKNRDNVEQHYLQDVVRGFGGAGTTKMLKSNSTDAEASVGADVTFAVTSDGYTITDTNYNSGELYYNGRTYASWNWKAGNSAGSSNTAGSITSTVSANPTAGFSISTFTSPSSGTCSFGHGLGVVPSLVIVKSRASGNWICEHISTGSQYLLLNGTGAATTDSTVFNSTPTSSVVNLGTGFAGTVNYVAYCWSEIAGFSKFGSYTGNGSADGTFVHLGFRPRYVVWKKSNVSGGHWGCIDSARNPYNLANLSQLLNAADADATNVQTLDLLSNGFKVRTSDAGQNSNGDTFIYMAFAESPFRYSLAR